MRHVRVRWIHSVCMSTHNVCICGETERHRAARCGPVEAVEVLLGPGEDIHAQGEHRRTALHVAALRGH